jgi:hypothetical protein
MKLPTCRAMNGPLGLKVYYITNCVCEGIVLTNMITF